MLRHSIVATIGLITCGPGITARADPSGPIAELMSQPVSGFDYFLAQLKDQMRCSQTYFDTGNRPTICMPVIDYHLEDNLIEMNVFATDKTADLQGFEDASADEKRRMLIALLHRVARAIGVEGFADGNKELKLGMIQLTPIRRGWATKDFDERAAKAEIVKRTVLNVRTNIGGYIYLVSRDQHGKVSADEPPRKAAELGISD